MKIFCSILAIMLFVLSCIPCNDAGAVVMNTAQLASGQYPQNEQRDSGAEHNDECSPFCQCSCCSVIYALPESIAPAAALKSDILTELFALYIQGHPSGIALPIWQPPQLV